MSHRKRVVLTEDLQEHPVVRAWNAATFLDTMPECIHVLRELPRYAIYWLPGVGAGGTAVFAKRSMAHRSLVERTVYEEILPHLPLTAPRYYGIFMEELYGWIFLEDVGDERYSCAEPKHLELAGRWVGTLHARAAALQAARLLPDAGPRRYLAHLRKAREQIRSSLRKWSFPLSEVRVLTATLSHCNEIEGRWDQVEAVCKCGASTLVHGDFRPKNALLRRNAESLTLCPIDWEMAGFGVPAVDLTRIDLRAYWHEVRSTWPRSDFEAVARLAMGGRLLQELAAVDWMSQSLDCDSVAGRSEAVADLHSVTRRLMDAARSASVLE